MIHFGIVTERVRDVLRFCIREGRIVDIVRDRHVVPYGFLEAASTGKG